MLCVVVVELTDLGKARRDGKPRHVKSIQNKRRRHTHCLASFKLSSSKGARRTCVVHTNVCLLMCGQSEASPRSPTDTPSLIGKQQKSTSAYPLKPQQWHVRGEDVGEQGHVKRPGQVVRHRRDERVDLQSEADLDSRSRVLQDTTEEKNVERERERERDWRRVSVCERGHMT